MFARSAKDAAKMVEYQNIFFNPVGTEYTVGVPRTHQGQRRKSSAGVKVHAEAATDAQVGVLSKIGQH